MLRFCQLMWLSSGVRNIKNDLAIQTQPQQTIFFEFIMVSFWKETECLMLKPC